MVVTLGELRALLAEDVPPGRGDEDSVRRQWWAALATIQEDLLAAAPPQPGVWLAAPLPALYEPAQLEWLDGWVWTPAEVGSLMPSGLPLLPGMATLPGPSGPAPPGTAGRPGGFRRLSLREEDGTDPVLVLITPAVQVALALDGPPQGRRLLVRFEAPILSAALELLDRRLAQDDPAAGLGLRRRLQLLGPLRNDPDLGSRFWPLLAQRLASMAPSVTLQPLVHGETRTENSEAVEQRAGPAGGPHP